MISRSATLPIPVMNSALRPVAASGAGARPAPSRRFFWHFPHYTNQGSRPSGAMREGILHDLLGRTSDRDARMATVERFLERLPDLIEKFKDKGIGKC